MKWKTWRCGLALLLAAAFLFSIQPVRAEGEHPTEKEVVLGGSGTGTVSDRENNSGTTVDGNNGTTVDNDNGTTVDNGRTVNNDNGATVDGSVSGNNPAVMPRAEGMAALSVSSLADPDAGIEVRDGVVYSTRKVLLDSYHGNTYDILLTYTGAEAMEKLSLELVSDTVELKEMPGESENQIRVDLTAMEGVEAGTDVSGTLTIRSAEQVLAVLTLTGTVGDPSITTLEIPETVLYVPYGYKLQSSNQYDWNQVYYRLDSGALPDGMMVRDNGEIYGVPKEKGEFTFTVHMYNYNHYTGFGSSSRTYTLVVRENTDENVDMSTDEGYELSERVQNIGIDSLLSVSSNSNVIPSQLLVSQGAYDEFVDVYLDGVRLEEGRHYQSESGSTRITIRSSTLISFGVGTHTLGVEFRTGITDTLKRAAQNFQVSEIVREPDAAQEDDDDSVGQVAEVVAEKLYYTVVKGDNLSNIARTVGSSLAQLLAWNPQIKNPDLIFPGQVFLVGYKQGSAAAAALSLEGAAYDEVKKGDCLYKIAGRNSVTLKAILDMNPEIAKQKYIYPGQKVRVR